MGEIKIFDKSDLIKLCISCPVLKKYRQYNLWSKECVEYNQLKYCSFYLSRYTFNFTKDFILRYFSLSFFLILYDSPIFIKFIKSGFIKYVDFNFLLFFRENFLMHSRRPDKEIENFVDLYFQRHIRKRFEKDLIYCIINAVNQLVPRSVRRPLILCIKKCYLNSVLKGTDYNRFIDLSELVNLMCKGKFEFGSLGIKKKLGISELFFTIFERKIYKSFRVYRRSLYFISSSLSISLFVFDENFRYKCINIVNKKYIFSLFFRGFCGFYFFLPQSNLDILLRGSLKNKGYKDFDYLFDFALEGLEEFDYKKTRIQLPGHHNSFHNINLKATIISGEILKDLPPTLNNLFLETLIE